MNELESIGVSSLYLLALINPISKVSILAGLPAAQQNKGFSSLAVRSTGVAAGVLFGAMIVGDWLLRSVFRVDLYSLMLAGGVVVFWVGMNALRRGVFFESGPNIEIEEMALVPLACPMIAGPATIAACIGLRAQHGILVPTAAMIIALGTNHLVMMFAVSIGRLLGRFNILSAIIRITGLIVMTIGTQMALDGIASWMAVKRM